MAATHGGSMATNRSWFVRHGAEWWWGCISLALVLIFITPMIWWLTPVAFIIVYGIPIFVAKRIARHQANT